MLENSIYHVFKAPFRGAESLVMHIHGLYIAMDLNPSSIQKERSLMYTEGIPTSIQEGRSHTYPEGNDGVCIQEERNPTCI